jgi:hypothetical protein
MPVTQAPLRSTNGLAVNFDEAAVLHVAEKTRKALPTGKALRFRRVVQDCVEEFAAGTSAAMLLEGIADKLIQAHRR